MTEEYRIIGMGIQKIEYDSDCVFVRKVLS